MKKIVIISLFIVSYFLTGCQTSDKPLDSLIQNPIHNVALVATRQTESFILKRPISYFKVEVEAFPSSDTIRVEIYKESSSNKSILEGEIKPGEKMVFECPDKMKDGIYYVECRSNLKMMNGQINCIVANDPAIISCAPTSKK